MTKEKPDQTHSFEYETLLEGAKRNTSILENRISNLFASQAFLFTAFVIGNVNKGKENNTVAVELFSCCVIPFVGLILSILVSIAIYSTLQELKNWRSKISAFYKKYDDYKNLFSIEGYGEISYNNSLIYIFGPVTFLFTWLVILLHSIFPRIPGNPDGLFVLLLSGYLIIVFTIVLCYFYITICSKLNKSNK
jgi:hypothetical protein